MARRRKKSDQLPLGLQAIIAIGILWVFTAGPQYIGFIVCAIVFLIVAAALGRELFAALARRSLIHKASIASDEQIDSLIRRQAQLLREDAYGRLQPEKWNKEIEYFISSYVTPRLTKSEKAALDRHKFSVAAILAERVNEAAKDRPIFQEFYSKMTPGDFEIFCAEQLKRAGWTARVTTASRDQGVDVIAEKLGVRVVLQCKLYGRPVGNKAVQEAAAAKAHEQAHHGIVVTNNGYTSAAEQLARTNGILLLHYSDLPSLDNLLPHPL